MLDLHLVFDSPNPKRAKSFSALFEDQFKNAKHVEIAVGYIAEKPLRYLLEMLKKYPTVGLTLTCGMQGQEGMTKKQIEAAKELDVFLQQAERGRVYVTPRFPYHGKVYRFSFTKGESAYVGSANLSSILPSHHQTFETGLFLKNAPKNLQTHLAREVYPFWVPVSEAEIPILEADNEPMRSIGGAQSLSTQQTVRIFNSPATKSFELPLKANDASSLNNHLAGKGARANKKTGARRSRDWYEGELIVDKPIRDLPGYPKLQEFDVVTDDGWAFRCVTNGQEGKNFRSKGTLGPFGIWMKSRFIEAGALEFGEKASQENIKRFGRDTMTIKYRPEFDVWTLDLSVPLEK